eukprot:252446_1
MWQALQTVSIQWPMVYTALPPLDPSSRWMPNGSQFYPSPPVDNSPPAIASSQPGVLFSFGWPNNATTAAGRAQGWYDLLKDVPGLPRPTAVHGQAWAEEPFILGAYGAWWPPGVMTGAGDLWDGASDGRLAFCGTEWSPVGAGYMNGAIHNGRRHGDRIHE